MLKDLPKYAARSHIFILLDSSDKRDSATDFCKKYKICPVSHIISQDSDKTIFYEAFYKILEKNLDTFLLDLETRPSTRQVYAIKCELNPLITKLQSRKSSAKSAPVLTQACIDKIERYVFYFLNFQLYDIILKILIELLHCKYMHEDITVFLFDF